MELGWFILACVVVGMILYGVIASKFDSAKRRRERRKRLPDADAPLQAGKQYSVQLSHGRKIERVTIIGMSEDPENESWQHRRWIVAEREDGNRVYMQPDSIRFIEDAQ